MRAQAWGESPVPQQYPLLLELKLQSAFLNWCKNRLKGQFVIQYLFSKPKLYVTHLTALSPESFEAGHQSLEKEEYVAIYLSFLHLSNKGEQCMLYVDIIFLKKQIIPEL